MLHILKISSDVLYAIKKVWEIFVMDCFWTNSIFLTRVRVRNGIVKTVVCWAAQGSVQIWAWCHLYFSWACDLKKLRLGRIIVQCRREKVSCLSKVTWPNQRQSMLWDSWNFLNPGPHFNHNYLMWNLDYLMHFIFQSKQRNN